jgi:hypothetical protein
MSDTLAEELQRCWGFYRGGRLGDLTRVLPLGHALLSDQLRSLSALEASNATVELAMLDLIVGMVTAANVDEVASVADDLAEMVTDAGARCDDMHKLAALSCTVHGAMRLGRFPLSQGRFRAALKMAQGLAAQGGGNVGMEVMGAILGAAGLHLAQGAATAEEEALTRQLLEQSDQTAAELGIEVDILGQFFGPEHARAVRCICMARLELPEEALRAGRAVNVEKLVPLMGATMLRVLADETEKMRDPLEAAALRARADALVPPLTGQFGAGSRAN